ncbi:MAG TPA: hypothetical protein VFV19_13970 [Candidatus Polarisedimenticolaceae bacterium]|nr:hypothetical protein [Candidatus Polarisedimenticolaceae bacterium]
MGLINWIFDFYQQYRIDQLQKDAAQTRAEMTVRAPNGALDAEKLERAVGEMALAVKTLQRMMVEKGLCTPDEFRAKLQLVDLEDGRADGRAPIG